VALCTTHEDKRRQCLVTQFLHEISVVTIGYLLAWEWMGVFDRLKQLCKNLTQEAGMSGVGKGVSLWKVVALHCHQQFTFCSPTVHITEAGLGQIQHYVQALVRELHAIVRNS
jgi:hypothetical protein